MPAMPETVTHQHLLRAMDALIDHADALEEALARQIRPLVDDTQALVVYDLTTVRIHAEGAVEDDIRAFGMNKEVGGIARQLVPGLVQNAEGLPLTHIVHPGNVGKTKTLQAMLLTVLQRFPVQRVILVAECAPLSLENVGELTTLADQSGRKLEFTFSPVVKVGKPSVGRVGIVSPTGAFGAYALALAQRRDIGISHWITTGNEVDPVEWRSPKRPAHSAARGAVIPKKAAAFFAR